jgi:hypothetical protein
MLFRKFLVRIRKEYHGDKKRLFLWSFIGLAASTLIGVAADAFIPFSGGWNALRSVILVPTALSIFILGYAYSLQLHYKRVKEDPTWVPFRMRMSPSWRRRVSAIAVVFAFVFIYANGYRIGYTFVSSLFAAAVIAIFAFMRTTREESRREEFNIPDTRDTKYESHRRKLAAERAAAIKQREAEKKAKKMKNLNKNQE